MTYPPPPDQSGQGGFQYDPYGNQPGSQPPSPQGGGYSPQPQQPGYPPQPQPGYQAQQPAYGPPQMPPAYGAPMMQQPKNGLGVAGMVTGIIGIVLFWCGIVGIVLAILAVVFGGVGIARANRGEATNKGMATAGVVLGVITLALDIVYWIWWGSVWGAAMTSSMY
ncbi:DUF4190 domain-containing protein [Glycomyces tenuis]|uniref:DUF4190 domain-containing protein n=1 Tax=Glycomyces tenuis TaxID=58116 RepID=UPI0009DC1146|nr:DUF4190 domain-containing protein [Glycomyces tenuis]